MKDQVVVITGASSGIGAALARLVCSQGASAILVARRGELLNEVAKACGPNAIAIVADVTSRQAVQGVASEALNRFGKIDIWVNNVGQGITRNPSQLTDEDIDSMMTTNVKSALYGMQEVLPHFKERGAGQVINVSSMLGRIPFVPFRAAYCGSKHFLNVLTATFRTEVQTEFPGIQFSLVSPPVVRTDFGLNALHGGPDSRSLGFSQSAEEVAQVIADVMGSRAQDVYTMPGSQERVAEYYAVLGKNP